jgi:hypothetical protein
VTGGFEGSQDAHEIVSIHESRVSPVAPIDQPARVRRPFWCATRSRPGVPSVIS